MTTAQQLNETLNISTEPGVQIWSMHAAPVNAVGPALLDDLTVALDAAVADDSVAVVILRSDLRVFSAGADAKWMAAVVAERGTLGLLEEFNRIMDDFRELCLRLWRAPLLVVASIGGHALAGGLELAAACDLRFAADEDRIQIGAPEMNLFGAMPSGGGGAQFLGRLMGARPALKFILDGTPVSPREAQALGIVDSLHAADELNDAVVGFACNAADKAGRIGIAAAKKALLGGTELPLAAALELDRSLHWDAMRRGNFLRGVESFVSQYGKSS
jgi:enoyl-CoA hydratase